MIDHSFTKDINGILFFDDGSSHNLILHSFARKLNLTGKKITQHMELTGITTTIQETILYEMVFKDINDTKHTIYLFGMQSITSDIGYVDISDVCQQFPEYDEQSLRRPVGEVSILIGMQEASLLPVCLATKGNVRIMSCLFGSGLIMSGSHEMFRAGDVQYTPEVLPFLDSLEDTHYYSINEDKTVKSSSHYTKIPTYYEGEELGISYKLATLCNPCQSNQEKLKERSILEEEELQLIKANVQLVDKQIHVSYPMIGDISKMKDNLWQVVKIAKSVERKLKKTKMVDNYNKEFNGLIQRGTLNEVSQDELEEWKANGGQVYLCHSIPPTLILKKKIHLLEMMYTPSLCKTVMNFFVNSSVKPKVYNMIVSV
jgi:hypothetical protein